MSADLFEAHLFRELPHQLLMLWVDGGMLQHNSNAADARIKHTLRSSFKAVTVIYLWGVCNPTGGHRRHTQNTQAQLST